MATVIEVKVKGISRRKGKGHKGIRSAKNRANHKYEMQALRSARNKARNRARNAAQGDPLKPINYRRAR